MTKAVTIKAHGRVLVQAKVCRVTWKKIAELYADALVSIIGDCSMTITQEQKNGRNQNHKP